MLVLDAQGNINLGETSPSIVSTSGTFGIIGQAILSKPPTALVEIIEINPDSDGIIKLTTEGTGSTLVGGFINMTNANLATGNLVNATINNDNRGYNFINFSNYDIGTTNLTSRFNVDAFGNTNIGATLTASNISIGNTLITATAGDINLLTNLVPTNGSVLYTNGSNITTLIPGTSGYLLQTNGIDQAPTWVAASSVGTTNMYYSGSGITVGVGNSINFGGAITQNTRLNIGNTEVMYINASTGYIGIGTTNPGQTLNVTGNTRLSMNDNSYFEYNSSGNVQYLLNGFNKFNISNNDTFIEKIRTTNNISLGGNNYVEIGNSGYNFIVRNNNGGMEEHLE